MNAKQSILKHIGLAGVLKGYGIYDNVITAMEDYANERVKNCSIPAVVGRSEQLKAFGKSLQYKGVRILTDEGVEQAVKDFERTLKAFNCLQHQNKGRLNGLC